MNIFLLPPSNVMKEEEKEIIEQVLAGDTARFELLVENYQSRVYLGLLGMTGNEQDAQDFTQEAFIKAFKKLATFKGQSSFYTWVYRIAFNLVIDYKRKKSNKNTINIDDEKGGVDSLQTASHYKSEHQHEANSREIQQLILQSMQNLDLKHRQIIILRELEGYSYAEIAKLLDISSGTVMSRLYHARKKVQEDLLKLGVI